MANRSELERLIEDAERSAFEGWDLSFLDGRYLADPLPFNYLTEVKDSLKNAESLLDVGTGGGELLSEVPFPADTLAKEGYPPNFEIAQKRLNSLGTKVVRVPEEESDCRLPFPNERFDLVINRHESYSPSEVCRVLKTGGIFLTQQVGGDDLIVLNRELGDLRPHS